MVTNKKLGIFVAFLAIFLFVLISVNALKYDCDVRLATSCNVAPWNNIVFKISATTNAHGEIYTQANYNYAFCCNFSSSRPASCRTDTDSNGYINGRVIGLSAVTNAHGEWPGSLIYANDVCYSDLECIQTGSPCDGNYPITAFSLSALTNAHIGDYSSYPSYRICCKNPNEPQPVQTCAAQGGAVCSGPKYCAGTSVPASDTLDCCVGCCANSDTTTCGTRICGRALNNCGNWINCPAGGGGGATTQDCWQMYGSCNVTGTQSCNAQGQWGSCTTSDPHIINCAGKVCGSDLCGGSCGSCTLPATCNEGTGQCICNVNETQSQTCTRVFGSGYQCGTTTDNCGGQVNCGTCSGGTTCNSVTGKCGVVCTPDCTNRQCGDNGCGTGTCGTCNATSSCDNPSGTCIQGAQPCTLTSSSWSSSKVTQGTTVTLTLNGNNCVNGENVRFDIAEVDCLIGPCKYSDKDSVDTSKLGVNYTTGIFNNGQATATWVAEWVNDTGLFTDADPEYAFNATVTSSGIGYDNSGELKVNKTGVVNPIAVIVSPKDRQIYFKPNTLSFEHASTGSIDKIEWEFGGDVQIQGQTGTFTNYNLTGANIYDKLNVTYLTSGQKVIRLTASNTRGGIGKAQISILVIESPFVMAYISSPRPYEIVSTSRGEVLVDANSPAGSYVVEGAGDITNASNYTVACLAGVCPDKTEGEIQGIKLNVTNWNTAPPLNTSSFLEFTWGFSGTSQTKNGRGTDLDMVTFEKIFSYAGDNWVDLNIKYYDGLNNLKAQSGSKNEFVVTKSETSCSQDGTEWIAPDNTRSSSLSNCKIGNNICCPVGKICDTNNNCVLTAAFLCSDLLDSNSCNNAPEWIAANSVRNDYGNPNLSIGDIIDRNIGGDPSCYSYLDAWWCAWENSLCVAKENLSYSSCGPSGSPPSSGLCVYTENTNDNCDDGILTYSWTARWDGNQSLIPPSCIAGSNSIECPAQIRLPFFSVYNFIVAIVAIFVVYFLISRGHKK